jgi:hypothetical protein
MYFSRGPSGTLWYCLSNSKEVCKFWILRSLGMWHYAVWCTDVNVLKEPSVPIFAGEEWPWDLYTKLHGVTSHQTLIVAIAVRTNILWDSSLQWQDKRGQPRNWGLIPGWGKGFFSIPMRSERFWDPPSLLSNGYMGLFPQRIRRPKSEAVHWIPVNADIKNSWSYTPFPICL